MQIINVDTYMIKRVAERKQMSSASGEPKTPAGENDDIKVQHTPTSKDARLKCKE